MNCWEILKIDRESADKRSIKKAYAKLLKVHRPDEDPEGFNKLREAYEEAQFRLENPDFEKAEQEAEFITVDDLDTPYLDQSEEVQGQQTFEDLTIPDVFKESFEKIESLSKLNSEDSRPELREAILKFNQKLIEHPHLYKEWNDLAYNLFQGELQKEFVVLIDKKVLLIELEHQENNLTVFVCDHWIESKQWKVIVEFSESLIDSNLPHSHALAYTALKLSSFCAILDLKLGEKLANLYFICIPHSQKYYEHDSIDLFLQAGTEAKGLSFDQRSTLVEALFLKPENLHKESPIVGETKKALQKLNHSETITEILKQESPDLYKLTKSKRLRKKKPVVVQQDEGPNWGTIFYVVLFVIFIISKFARFDSPSSNYTPSSYKDKTYNSSDLQRFMNKTKAEMDAAYDPLTGTYKFKTYIPSKSNEVSEESIDFYNNLKTNQDTVDEAPKEIELPKVTFSQGSFKGFDMSLDNDQAKELNEQSKIDVLQFNPNTFDFSKSPDQLLRELDYELMTQSIVDEFKQIRPHIKHLISQESINVIKENLTINSQEVRRSVLEKLNANSQAGLIVVYGIATFVVDDDLPKHARKNAALILSETHRGKQILNDMRNSDIPIIAEICNDVLKGQ